MPRFSSRPRPQSSPPARACHRSERRRRGGAGRSSRGGGDGVGEQKDRTDWTSHSPHPNDAKSRFVSSTEKPTPAETLPSPRVDRWGETRSSPRRMSIISPCASVTFSPLPQNNNKSKPRHFYLLQLVRHFAIAVHGNDLKIKSHERENVKPSKQIAQ